VFQDSIFRVLAQQLSTESWCLRLRYGKGSSWSNISIKNTSAFFRVNAPKSVQQAGAPLLQHTAMHHRARQHDRDSTAVHKRHPSPRMPPFHEHNQLQCLLTDRPPSLGCASTLSQNSLYVASAYHGICSAVVAGCAAAPLPCSVPAFTVAFCRFDRKRVTGMEAERQKRENSRGGLCLDDRRRHVPSAFRV
jgi:hypothetical protein